MNILVIMLDTLRPDYLGCNGNKTVKTPNLDAFAAQGANFTCAYAECPNTIPSRTAFISGIYTFTNRPWQALLPDDLHLAEILREAGYYTVAFSDTPFNNGAKMDRGFNEFHHFSMGKCLPPADGRPVVDYSDAYFPPGYPEKEVLYYAKTKTNRVICQEQFGCTPGERFFDTACQWLHNNNQDKPFFMWVDSFQPHEPWDAGEPYRSMYGPEFGHEGRYLPMPMAPDADQWMMPQDYEHLQALYKASATESDALVGELLKTLEETGLAEDTLVVILSDHGMPLGEHKLVRKFGYPLYDDLARIVWQMRKPGLIEPGLCSDSLVSNVDFMPTMLELAGVEHEFDLDGINLNPLLRNEAERVRDQLFLGAFNYRTGVRTDQYKFIDNRGEQPNELYDILTDPLELNNILPDMPQLGAELHKDIWDFHGPWKAKRSRHHLKA